MRGLEQSVIMTQMNGSGGSQSNYPFRTGVSISKSFPICAQSLPTDGLLQKKWLKMGFAPKI